MGIPGCVRLLRRKGVSQVPASIPALHRDYMSDSAEAALKFNLVINHRHKIKNQELQHTFRPKLNVAP